MEKTIKIGNKKVRLSNNVGWMMEYRDQFNHDIIPVLMPMLAALLDIVGGVIDTVGKTENIGYNDLIAAINNDKIYDSLIHMSGLEFVELINIVWAMAKTADETIPEPREWIREFDVFPVDEITPVVFKMITDGVVSLKNVKRLTGMIESLKPSRSASTILSSPESNED